MKKAVKSMSFPRIFICGKTGCGKTASALRILEGIKDFLSEKFPNDKLPEICIIDTEYKRSLQYAGNVNFSDREYDFNFIDVYDEVGEMVDHDKILSPLSPLNIAYHIRDIQKNNPEVKLLAIDSLSLAWDNVLDNANDVELIDEKKYNGYTKWRHPQTKPAYKKMLKDIIAFPGAVVCTIRSKMDYAQKTVEGKTVIVKLGVNPILMPEGEYEATMILEAKDETSGVFIVTKDNSGMGMTGKEIEYPDEKFGYSIMEYLFMSGGDNIYANNYLSKSTAEIKDKILKNKQKILDNNDYLTAFNSIYNIELLDKVTDADEADLLKAWNAVLEVKRGEK